MHSFFEHSRAANSVVGDEIWQKFKLVQAFIAGPILPSFEPIQAFIAVLVICKDEEDPMKMEELEC